METFSTLLGFVMPIHQSLVNFHHKRPVTWNFDVFFKVQQNKLLKKTVESAVIWDARMLMWHHCKNLTILSVSIHLLTH